MRRFAIKTPSFLFAFLAIFLAFQGCKNKGQDALNQQISDAVSAYVYAYSSGTISRASSIIASDTSVDGVSGSITLGPFGRL